MNALTRIQTQLKAPKSQYNDFGKFNYRSCEDILEAVKPLLEENATLGLNDELVMVGARYYIKATATLVVETSSGQQVFRASAFAREDETKKGMDGSQITGSASSYARKYALNGLFLIDDTKDADTRDNRETEKKKAPPKVATEEPPPPSGPPVDPAAITAKQRGMLFAKMKEAGLNDVQKKAFYDWVAPKSKDDASKFIDGFQMKLDLWRVEQRASSEIPEPPNA